MRRLFVAALLLLGCGTPPPPTYDAFFDQMMQVMCEASTRCCGLPADQCPTILAPMAPRSRDDADAALTAGALVYHPDTAATCLDSTRQAFSSCDNDARGMFSTLPSCRSVLTGSLQTNDPCFVGGGCASDLTCVTGLYCFPPSPPLATGMLCLHPEDCQSGACLFDPTGVSAFCAASGTVTNAWLCVTQPI
jgi:hypothetical protein